MRQLEAIEIPKRLGRGNGLKDVATAKLELPLTALTGLKDVFLNREDD